MFLPPTAQSQYSILVGYPIEVPFCRTLMGSSFKESYLRILFGTQFGYPFEVPFLGTLWMAFLGTLLGYPYPIECPNSLVLGLESRLTLCQNFLLWSSVYCPHNRSVGPLLGQLFRLLIMIYACLSMHMHCMWQPPLTFISLQMCSHMSWCRNGTFHIVCHLYRFSGSMFCSISVYHCESHIVLRLTTSYHLQQRSDN